MQKTFTPLQVEILTAFLAARARENSGHWPPRESWPAFGVGYDLMQHWDGTGYTVIAEFTEPITLLDADGCELVTHRRFGSSAATRPRPDVPPFHLLG